MNDIINPIVSPFVGVALPTTYSYQVEYSKMRHAN